MSEGFEQTVDPALYDKYKSLVVEVGNKLGEIHALMQTMAGAPVASVVTSWCAPLAFTFYREDGKPVSNVYLVTPDEQPAWHDLGLLETCAAELRNDL